MMSSYVIAYGHRMECYRIVPYLQVPIYPGVWKLYCRLELRIGLQVISPRNGRGYRPKLPQMILINSSRCGTILTARMGRCSRCNGVLSTIPHEHRVRSGNMGNAYMLTRHHNNGI